MQDLRSKESLKNFVASLLNRETGMMTFAKTFLPALLSFNIPEFHKEIYKLLINSLRLAMAAPRSFAKTTLTDIIYPSYLSMFNIPNRNNIAIFSASQSLSIDQLRKIKHLYDTNEALISLYASIHGMLPHTDKEKWREDEIEFTNGVRIQACGAGSQTRGKRPNVIICDDLETTEGVRSPEQRKYLDEWFRKDIIGMLEPASQLIIIGTILHFDSLLKNLLDTMPAMGWNTRIYKAYIDGIQKKGNELWVEKWSHEELQQRKAEQGSTYFSFEYMNEPISAEDAVFKESNIRLFDALPVKHSMVQVLDPAYSERNTSDYKACVVVAVDDKNNRYVVDRIRTKNPELEYINSCINMYIKYRNRITLVGIPAGREVDFFNKFIEISASRGIAIPHKEIKNVARSATGVSERNKKARITMTLQALFEQGKYYIKTGFDDIVDELLQHPHGKHDDLIDCMASAEQIITPVFFDYGEEKQTLYDNIETKKVYRGETGYGI